MLRRELVKYVVATAAWPLTARAQQKAMPVIGYLGAGKFDPSNAAFAAFHQGLRDQGYVEGSNLAIEYRFAEGKTELLPGLAAELVARKVDLIVCGGGTLAALAAKNATTTIPIVFTAIGDPVAEGLVQSLAQPGGNVTGMSLVQPDLTGKWLELVKETVPSIRLVAVLLKPDALPDMANQARVKGLEDAARELGLRLHFVEARGPADFDSAFADIAEARADALVVFATPVFDPERRRLMDLATKRRLPTISSFRWYAEAGGLMAYGPSLEDANRRAADYVDKILKGAKPSDLPVQRPTKVELVINLKTAGILGLTVPQSILARADEVIE